MGMDRRIKEAIKEAVKEYNQDNGLANKLIAWFNGLASGNESLEDRDSVARHLDLLYEATEIEDKNDRLWG
jgi:hypothetical protein